MGDTKEQTTAEAKAEVQRRLKEIERKSKKKEQKPQMEVSHQIATRAKLERDYIEDTIAVTFKSSPQTERTVLARRPNNEEYLKLLTLGIQLSKLETNPNATIEEITSILRELGGISAKLTVDKSLDKTFCNTMVSSITLQLFVNALLETSQSDYGQVPESEMKSFR
jgi:hypothetical protein